MLLKRLAGSDSVNGTEKELNIFDVKLTKLSPHSLFATEIIMPHCMPVLFLSELLSHMLCFSVHIICLYSTFALGLFSG